MAEAVFGTERDIEPWIGLVRGMHDNFPGLETEEGLDEYRSTVLEFMEENRALCVREGAEIVGVLLFSVTHNMICCLAVSPAHRRRGIASALMTEALQRLDRSRDITVTTFREDDPRGRAPRALYKKFGFDEGDFIVEFGCPSQTFVLRGRLGEYELVPNCGEISADHSLKTGSGKFYALTLRGRDILRVEVDNDDWNPFNSAAVWGRFFCLGTGGEIIIVDMNTFEYRHIEVDRYFGYFFQYGDMMFAASASGVLAFDGEMNLLWRNEDISVDGVLFRGVEGGALCVSCELDPPGGWVNKRLDIVTGGLL